MILECVNLHKHFGSKRAVDGVDLSLERGKIHGLLGPNGAGKSTLLKMVTGLSWPSEGYATVNGYDVHREHSQALANTGAIIEWPSFFPYLTARENIRIFTGRRDRKFNARIEDAARFVGMEKWLDKKAGTFSTGMKQRIGLALAMLPDSSFLILDEPANGLDPNGIAELRHLLKKINSEKDATILVSSHLLGEVEQVCSDVAIINQGKLVASGEIESFTQDRGKVRIGVKDPAKAIAILESLKENMSLGEAVTHEEYILLEAPEDSVGHINRALVEDGHHVHHISFVRRSLEEVFYEVTGGQTDV